MVNEERESARNGLSSLFDRPNRVVNDDTNDPNRVGTYTEMALGCTIGYVVGFWAFLCMIGNRPSRRFRAGLYFGFLFWFITSIDNDEQAQSQHKHQVDKSHQDVQPVSPEQELAYW